VIGSTLVETLQRLDMHYPPAVENLDEVVVE